MDGLGERYEDLCLGMSTSSGYADEKLLRVKKLLHVTDKAQAEPPLM